MGIIGRFKREVGHLRSRKARKRAIQDFRRSLALIVEFEALEASVATRLKELFNPDRLVVLQLDHEAARYRQTTCSGVDPGVIRGSAIRQQGKLTRWFLVNETCLSVIHDPGVVRYLDEPERQLFEAIGLQLCAPLLARNHVAGMLLLGWNHRDRYPTRRDAELLMDLGNQASLAFQNAAHYREQQQRLERLHRADRLSAIGQLAASVAHEVGNPLTAIRSTIQYLLSRLEENDENHELVEELISEVDRIRSTIGSMLSLARPGAFEPSDIDLVEVLAQTLHLVDVKARNQLVKFDQRFAQPSIPARADPHQLRQVFVNLILNALQAMPGGGKITVAASLEPPQPAEPDVRWAAISITDDGPGIPSQQLAKVFDRFFTTRSDGTGLGLAICRDIVHRHMGRIELSSVEGEGTTVSIRLPSARVQAIDPSQST